MVFTVTTFKTIFNIRINRKVFNKHFLQLLFFFLKLRMNQKNFEYVYTNAPVIN